MAATSLNDLMNQYTTARADYVTALKAAYTDTDTTSRQSKITALQAKNATLVGIATNLVSMWSALSASENSNQALTNLDADLVRYRQDLDTMKGIKDETTKLNTIYADITGDVSANRTMYLVYVIVVLVLLVAVFVMFVLRGISSVGSSVAEIVLPSSGSDVV
jgi:hypothetical protein